jgi:hypothetical protein
LRRFRTAASRCASVILGCVCIISPLGATPATTKIFPREVEIMKQAYNGPYQRSIVENDYFIFGDTATIDSPIITNGGNITIFVDKLIVNAPLDTRLRIGRSGNYWTHNTSENEVYSNDSSLFDQLRNSPKAMLAFDSLYDWRDTYNAKIKKYIYGQLAPEAVPPADGAASQLPSGRVPLASHKEYGHSYDTVQPSDGEDAPDANVIWDHAKSGNIKIYANSVTLCDSCEATKPDGLSGRPAFLVQPKPPDSDAFDPKITEFPDYIAKLGVFFQAAGAKGGRGGAGTVTPCPGHYDGGTGCAKVTDRNGGLSGMPGRGGDAGNVEFHFVNSKPSSVDQLIYASSVTGGRPAQLFRKRTPSWAALNAQSNRDVFTDETPIQNIDSRFGKDGTIKSDFIDSNQALSEITRILIEAHLGRNYSISRILQLARADDNPSLDPMDSLRSFLISELRSLQKQLLSDIHLKLNSQTIQSVKYDDLLSTLNCKKLGFVSLPSLLSNVMNSVCQFQKIDDLDSVESYFTVTGGIFRTSLNDIRSLEYFNSMSKDLVDIKGLMSNLIDESIKNNIFVFTTVREEQKRKLLEKISELQQKLDSLNTAGPTVSKTTDTLIENGKNIGKDMGKATAAIVAEDWVTTAISLGDAFRNLEPFLTNDIGIVYPDTAEIELKITELRQSLAALIFEIDSTRSQMLSLQNANLAKFVNLQNDYARIDVSELKTFDSAVSLAMQAYVADPGQRISVLSSELQVIGSALDGYYQLYAQLNLQPIRDWCVGFSGTILKLFDGPDRRLGCELASRDSSPYIVIPRPPLPGIPLLLVQKGTGSFPVSFGRLFDSREIQRINVQLNDE